MDLFIISLNFVEHQFDHVVIIDYLQEYEITLIIYIYVSMIEQFYIQKSGDFGGQIKITLVLLLPIVE